MIVVDVETTGVDPRLCSLVSIGAVDFDNPGNQFYMECRAFDGAHVEREALAVAGCSTAEINNTNRKTDREAVEIFLVWMRTCKEWTLAGQNPSFDRDFLQETAHRYHMHWPLAHRTVDLHTIACERFWQTGREIPRKNNHSALNLDRILEYVGLPAREHAHNALEDAKLEGEALSRLVYGKNLLEDYERFPIQNTHE